jgi:hypothetical protein
VAARAAGSRVRPLNAGRGYLRSDRRRRRRSNLCARLRRVSGAALDRGRTALPGLLRRARACVRRFDAAAG